MRYISAKKKRKKFHRHPIFIVTLAAIFFLISIFTKVPLFTHSQRAMATPGMAIQTPLSTRGAKIIDAKGKTVLLRGVNWFGIETETQVPQGLWQRDYKDMLSQIKQLGYNLIRLPYSVQALRSDSPALLPDATSINYAIGSNKDLQGKTPVEVMDLIIQEAERQGLLILLDSHRLNNQRIPELWYGDGFTEADWIDTWKMLATRYKNQANVIGADLKNEPHGKASWGTGDLKTDWRLAAERAGNEILAINPNWLIVVEGVEKNVPNQVLKIHWQGGNLEGVKRYPVRLSRRNKLVYSPHDYGPGVYNQPYFADKKFPENLIHRWQIGFHYISSQNLAPILIGEFGGRQVDTKSPEGIWQNKLVEYIKQKNLSFAYWSWNPNSADTGGILLDDWHSVDIPKQQLLSQLLPVKLTPELIAQMGRKKLDEVETSNTDKNVVNLPLPIASNSSQLQAKTDIYSDWDTGFCVNFKISNQSDKQVTNWQLSFDMNQASINKSWNGKFIKQGQKYIVNPLDWGKIIEPNQVINIGFCAQKLGLDYQPKNLKVN
ncbi:MAG: cellulase family glycosylhydrolase [Calothrix sp. MO_192.B10]|nr:cellulase family glycosylhydrolase [Calothrix sp. MO_192.B10]